MALDLEIAGEVRELTDGDIPKGAEPYTLKRIRDSHHALAQCLASGNTAVQASLQTGYSISSISRLLLDPAFKELMAHYAATKEAAFVDMQSRIALFAADVQQELHERLHEAPESFTNDELTTLRKHALDQAGYAPITRSLQITKNLGYAEALDARKRRREEAA